MEKAQLTRLFETWCSKLRITSSWDVKLELVEDPAWNKTGDFKVDCDDRKAVFLLNVVSPKQENLEEVIVHELLHLKLYPRFLSQKARQKMTSLRSAIFLNLMLRPYGLWPPVRRRSKSSTQPEEALKPSP